MIELLLFLQFVISDGFTLADGFTVTDAPAAAVSCQTYTGSVWTEGGLQYEPFESPATASSSGAGCIADSPITPSTLSLP